MNDEKSNQLQQAENQSESITLGDFTIGNVFKGAFAHLKGAKWAIWAPTLCLGILIYVLFLMILVLFSDQSAGPWINRIQSLSIPALIVQNVIYSILACLFSAGITRVLLKKVRNESVSLSDSFYFIKNLANEMPKLVALIIVALALGIISTLISKSTGVHPAYGGTIPIILYYFVVFSYFRIIDKGVNAWTAIVDSLKMLFTGFNWLKVFVVVILSCLLMVVSAIPIGIGLIWTLPLYQLILGVMYVMLFDK